MARKKQQSLHYVEERLLILKAIKAEDWLDKEVPKYRKLAKVKRLTDKSQDKSDYATNVGFSVKTTKDAELLAWMQEYNFIPLSDEARKKVELLKRIWKYHWITSKTDKRLSRVVPESTTTWTGWMYEGLKTIKREINEPTKNDDGSISFEKKEVPTYDWVWCEFIPFENFFIDWTDIENSNEAIWVKFWDRQEFINEHRLMPWYNTSNIPLGKDYTYVWSDWDPKKWQDDETIVTEIRYYNKSKDQFIVLANWKEVKNSAIPFTHKELPFMPFYDYPVEDRIWGMWEFELLAEDIIYKDAIRSLSIDVIKAQMWVVAVNDDIDFDETTWEYWPFSYMKVNDISGIKHFSPNISTNAIDNAEQKVDNDIISKTGVDFKSQLLSPNETATRTAAKSQSSKKRINLNLKINGYNFFERLARLRLSNIRLWHSNKDKVEIPVEGGNIKEDWTFEPINGWYGSLTVTPDMITEEYNIVPITDSILWATEEREKNKAIEAVQLLSWMVWADWKPVFDWTKLWEFLADRLHIDFIKLSWKEWASKDPSSILDEIDKQDKWISTWANDPSSPDFIPPEQRSGASKWVSLSWQQVVSDSDILS